MSAVGSKDLAASSFCIRPLAVATPDIVRKPPFAIEMMKVKVKCQTRFVRVVSSNPTARNSCLLKKYSASEFLDLGLNSNHNNVMVSLFFYCGPILRSGDTKSS